MGMRCRNEGNEDKESSGTSISPTGGRGGMRHPDEPKNPWNGVQAPFWQQSGYLWKLLFQGKMENRAANPSQAVWDTAKSALS